MFDQRLQPTVIQIVDVSYGGENGFNQAIELASESLKNVKFVTEKRLLTAYFGEISQDTGKYCFGIRDTFYALDNGAVETLIVYEDLSINRYEVRNKTTNEKKVFMMTPEERNKSSFFPDAKENEIEVEDEVSLVEYLANNYKNFGAKLEFVTDKSQEGSQFVKGFGGIGGLLRYQLDFATLDEDNEVAPADGNDSEEDSDFDFM
jgi:peptide chain release factor subunit 1